MSIKIKVRGRRRSPSRPFCIFRIFYRTPPGAPFPTPLPPVLLPQPPHAALLSLPPSQREDRPPCKRPPTPCERAGTRCVCPPDDASPVETCARNTSCADLRRAAGTTHAPPAERKDRIWRSELHIEARALHGGDGALCGVVEAVEPQAARGGEDRHGTEVSAQWRVQVRGTSRCEARPGVRRVREQGASRSGHPEGKRRAAGVQKKKASGRRETAGVWKEQGERRASGRKKASGGVQRETGERRASRSS